MRYDLTVGELEVIENALNSYIAHLEKQFGREDEEMGEVISDAEKILEKINPS